MSNSKVFERSIPILAALAFATGGASASPTLTPGEIGTLTDMQSLLICGEEYRKDLGRYPGPVEGFVEAAFLRPHVAPMYIAELPVLDAWGHSFRYAATVDRMAIVSYGPDGLADREYASLAALEPAEGAGDDMVLLDGRMFICPEHICLLERLGAQKRTMADIRSIATAVEAYAVDNKVYPGSTSGYVPAEWLRQHVEPAYIRTLPLADAWGNPILYWSDGKGYRVISNGMDGQADRPYEKVQPRAATSTFASDIVFGDGLFLQWPEGEQH